MAHPYKPPVDYRTTASAVTGEPIIIDAQGYALLAEAPADPANVATPMVVVVNSTTYTRVTGSPTAGQNQYRVRTQAVTYADGQPHTEYVGVLEFHPTEAGRTGTVNYYRVGTVYTSLFFEALLAHSVPLVGAATVNDLPPPTTSLTARGYPGDQAYLSDGRLYYSDGTAWNAVAGGTAALMNRTVSVDAHAVVQTARTVQVLADVQVGPLTTYTPSITADALVQATLTKTVDGNALVQGNRTVQVNADAQVDSSGAPTTMSDNFTGTNGAAPNSTNWPTITDENGYGFTAEIQSNRLRLTATGSLDGENPLLGGGSCTSMLLSRGGVTRTLAVSQITNGGRLVFYIDANNYVAVESTDNTHAVAFRVVGGTYTPGSSTTVPSLGQMTIAITSGGAVTAAVGGTTVMSFTAAGWGDTYYARLSRYVNGDTTASTDFDDFSVT